jgi:hypothetical protein
MQLTLTIADLRAHDACDLYERIVDLTRELPSVQEDTPVPLSVWWALPSTSIADRFWSLRCVQPRVVAKQLGVSVACLAARRVQHLVDMAHRAVCLAAIEAAEAWAEAPTEENQAAAYAAADADYAGAYAAYAAADAAYSAADAAGVAYVAAYSAADAAGVAYVAAAGDAYVAGVAYVADSAACAAYSAADAAAADAADAERELQRADLDRLLAAMKAEGVA